MSRALYITTPVLDDCNRADENPLSNNGGWTNMADSTLFTNNVSLRLVSKAVINASVTNNGGASWNRASFSDCEVWANWNQTFGNPGGYIGLRLANIGTGTTDGYRLSVGGSQLLIQRIDNSVATTLRTFQIPGGAGGFSGRVMFRSVGTKLSAHRFIGTDVPENWTEVIAAEDATYTSGSLGVMINSSYNGVLAVGGGSTSGLVSGMPLAQPVAGRGATW